MRPPEFDDDPMERLRARLRLPRPPVDPGPRPASTDQAGSRSARALAAQVARRAARPVVARAGRLLTPGVSEAVAERLLGRLEPEVAHLRAEVELLKAEVADLRRTGPDSGHR